ncbi:MAG: dUTP diphosphatase [Bacteroidota bacterium]|nr:dUTP diphosphatase [Bacteroidota bacterium]
MILKIINKSPHSMPNYATVGSAGLDITAWVAEGNVLLQSLERIAIPTGLFLQIPAGYEGQLRPRSGNALKYGLTLLNSPGTIDSDYRGEVKVIVVNLSNEPVKVTDGQRIAQLVIAAVHQVKVVEVSEIEPSVRGEGGFGHTG